MKALRQKVDEEEHLELYGGLREGIGMKTYLHGPIDCEKLETVISERRPRPTRKKEEVYQLSSGGRRRRTDLPLWRSKRE